jgi:hypothetical protein
LTTSFLALYRGESVSAARLLALTADPGLVSDFTARMLEEREEQEQDAVVRELEQGRRRVLQLVYGEASE